MKGEFMLKIDMEYNRNILFVRLDGVLTRMTTYKINNYSLPVILKHKIKYLVYNLGRLKDIDESGIDALLNTKYAIKNNKGLIYLSDINKNLNRKLHSIKIKKTQNEKIACKLLEA